MVDANLQYNNPQRLSGLTFSTDMKFNDYIESIPKSAAKTFLARIFLARL